MRFVDTLLISLSVVFLIIGAYEVFAVGLGPAYGPLMAALALFFWYSYRKKTRG